MSHSYRIIPDAKFEFGIFSIFGDDTQTFPLKRGEQVIEFVYLPPENGFKLYEFFYVQGHSFQPRIDSPPDQFQQFPSRRNFSIFFSILKMF